MVYNEKLKGNTVYNRKIKTSAHSVYVGDLIRFGGQTWLINSVKNSIDNEIIIKGARPKRGGDLENAMLITLVLDPDTWVTLVQ